MPQPAQGLRLESLTLDVDAPRFDVAVRFPPHTDLNATMAAILRRAVSQAGLPEPQIAPVLVQLCSVPVVPVARGMTQDQAEQVRRRFALAGLVVSLQPAATVRPVASLAAGADGAADRPPHTSSNTLTDALTDTLTDTRVHHLAGGPADHQHPASADAGSAATREPPAAQRARRSAFSVLLDAWRSPRRVLDGVLGER